MSTQPSLPFVQSLQAALTFWRERVVSEPPQSLEQERHNLYRAVQLGLSLPPVQPIAAEVATGAFPFIFAGGYWPEWLAVMEQAAQAVVDSQETAPGNGAQGADEQGPVRFQLLTRLGQLRRLNGRLADAVDAHREALAVAQNIAQPLFIAEAQYHLGRALRDVRRYAEAQERLQEAQQTLAAAAEDGAEQQLLALAANIYNALGRVAHDRGELPEAQTHLALAVATHRKHGQPVALADSLQDLGNVLRESGAYGEARDCLMESLTLLQGSGQRLNHILVQQSLGALYFAQRDYVQAERVFREIDVAFLRETGNLQQQAAVLTSLGNALLYQTRNEEAAQALQESIDLWRQLEDPVELANATGSLGEAFAALGRKEAAHAQFGEALELLAPLSDSAKGRRLHAFFERERQKLADD